MQEEKKFDRSVVRSFSFKVPWVRVSGFDSNCFLINFPRITNFSRSFETFAFITSFKHSSWGRGGDNSVVLHYIHGNTHVCLHQGQIIIQILTEANC